LAIDVSIIVVVRRFLDCCNFSEPWACHHED
jgi:hypothetical protein